MKKTRFSIGATLIAIGLVITIAIRFTNIDMTETRLLVTYWGWWIAVLVLEIGGYFLIRSSEK